MPENLHSQSSGGNSGGGRYVPTACYCLGRPRVVTVAGWLWLAVGVDVFAGCPSIGLPTPPCQWCQRTVQHARGPRFKEASYTPSLQKWQTQNRPMSNRKEGL